MEVAIQNVPQCQLEIECIICMEKIKDKDCVTTECGHRFHASCLFKNNAESDKCPLCRAKIAPKPEKTPKMHEEIATAIVQPILNNLDIETYSKSVYEIFKENLVCSSHSSHPPGNGKILPNNFNELPHIVRSQLRTQLGVAFAEIGIQTCHDIGRWLDHYNDDIEIPVDDEMHRDRSRAPSPSPLPSETDPEMPDLLDMDENGNLVWPRLETDSDSEDMFGAMALHYLQDPNREDIEDIVSGILDDEDNRRPRTTSTPLPPPSPPPAPQRPPPPMTPPPPPPPQPSFRTTIQVPPYFSHPQFQQYNPWTYHYESQMWYPNHAIQTYHYFYPHPPYYYGPNQESNAGIADLTHY